MSCSIIYNPPVFIITGKRSGGKSSFLLKLINELKRNEIDVSGIVAVATSRNQTAHSYSMLDIKSGATLPLSTRSLRNDWIKTGNFHFNPEALEAITRIITHPEFVDQVIRNWDLQVIEIFDVQKSPSIASQSILKRIKINKP